MTTSEMEDAIIKLTEQTNRIEQFLPSLVTRGEFQEAIVDAKRYALILNEATRDEIRLLAENVRRLSATMATRDDLAGVVTKDDAIRFATKDDLALLVTK